MYSSHYLFKRDQLEDLILRSFFSLRGMFIACLSDNWQHSSLYLKLQPIKGRFLFTLPSTGALKFLISNERLNYS